MTQLHTPPELTPDGARLLADVLAKRQTPAPAEAASIEVGPPRRGLPVIVGLVLGAVILGSTAVWIAFETPFPSRCKVRSKWHRRRPRRVSRS